MADVAACNGSVFIYYQRTLSTFAYRHDLALGNTLGIGCVAELIHQLLLGVVCHDTPLRYIHPKVFPLVDIHYLRSLVESHLCIHLFHVALKAFRLRVIYTHSRWCLHPQVAVERLLKPRDIAVGKRRTVLRVALEVFKRIAVITVESGWRTEPYVSSRILQYAVYLTAIEPVSRIQCLEVEYGSHCQWQ